MKILSSGLLMLMCSISIGSAQASHGDGNAHCTHAVAAHIACVVGITDDASWVSTAMYTPPPVSASMPWQGNTVATVGSQYPTVINWIWQTETAAQLNAQMAVYSDLSLARFSHHYWVESHGNLAPLLYYASLKLTAPNLLRLRAALGSALDASIVNATPTVQAQYRAAVKRSPIPQSHAAYVQAGKLARTVNAMYGGIPAPTIEMTFGEIFEEFLWTGAQTETGALALTVKFASIELQIAALIGWHAGGHFYHFMENIDPNYGYDITTMYGDYNLDFGPIGDPISGRGYLNDGDIVVVELDQF